MLAEFSVTPIDKTQEGFSKYVAQSLKIVKESGLDYRLTAMGTLVEGDSEAVFELIKQVHLNMASQSERVSTSIKIDDRRGFSQRLSGKISSVEAALGETLKTE